MKEKKDVFLIFYSLTEQVEQHSDTNILIKNCMNELLGKIFYFIPDRKILFLQKEYKYICFILLSLFFFLFITYL